MPVPHYRHILAIDPFLSDLPELKGSVGFGIERDGGTEMNRVGIVLVVIAGLVGAGLFALSA